MTLPISLSERYLTRRAFQKFADRYDLVYFGSVSQHSDDHQLVRGITLSSGHRDNYYSVGSIRGRDIIALQRTDTVTFPGKESATYRWLILQLDLRSSRQLPQVFVNGSHYADAFYANAFLKQPQLHNFAEIFTGSSYDPQFARQFRIFSPRSAGSEQLLLETITSDVAAATVRYLLQHDFELTQNELIIYGRSLAVRLSTLEHLLKAGLWLAEQFEQV